MSDHGHFTPRPCQNCKDKDAEIERLRGYVKSYRAEYLELEDRAKESERIFHDQYGKRLAEIERLQKRIKFIYTSSNGDLYAEIERLREREAYLLREWKRAGQARDKLQAVVDAVIAHRDNDEFLNIDTWRRCVAAAEAALEEGSWQQRDYEFWSGFALEEDDVQ